MKPNIVFLDEYTLGGADLTRLHELGRYTGYSTTAPDEVADRCRDAEIVITNKVVMRRQTLAALPGLRLICIAATGMNNIDLDAAAELGIVVRNAAGYSTHSVAETTLGAAIALRRHIVYYDRYVKSGAYSAAGQQFHFAKPTHQLYGSKWGIVGLGAIGHEVARLAAAFGCEVRYTSTSGAVREEPYPAVSLPELLGWADTVSVHAPLNDRTRGLIGAPELAVMKQSAILVNVARGGSTRRHWPKPSTGDRSQAPRSTYSRTSRWPRTTRCWTSANPTGCCSRPTTHGRRAKPSTCW